MIQVPYVFIARAAIFSMRICIDEAGPFVPPASQQSSYDLVLALVIPSSSEAELFYEFLRLRDSWPGPQQVEIKGSKLDEGQAAQVIDLLAQFDVLVHFVAVDTAMHGAAVVDDFKSRQAQRITAHITREHHPEMVHQLAQLERAMNSMPNQLFVQAQVTMDLMFKTVCDATLYYVQRDPTELGDIAWDVDRKGRTLTQMEEMWSTLILPMSESHFMREPIIFLKEGDYSHFTRKYETNLADDPEMARHLAWTYQTYGKAMIEEQEKESVINARLLLTEQLRFLDSTDSLGLQLADMLAATLRRAFNSRLQRSGWERFGRLVVHDPEPGWFKALGGQRTHSTFPQRVVEVWEALNRHSKPMLLR